ncbi:MAG: HAMP domain-containing sensor histidine kinase [Bacteroidota bacterium]|nr:HAMP domain-containing sensor histidine kinase [Bacteroidota bacterium]
MKLFARYSRVNIIASMIALLLGSLAYYFIIRYVLIRQLDNTLRVEEAEILDFVRNRGRLPEPANYRDQQIAFSPAKGEIERRFVDTVWTDPRSAAHRPFRQLLFSVVAGGRTWLVTVGKSEAEAKRLLGWIVMVTLGMIVLLIVILFLANRWLLRRLWRPFYDTLESMRRFNLASKQPLPPAGAGTGIDEFESLDAAARQMTDHILRDYEMLKQFADNASHEMQTPLAIINSKLDLMIQDSALGERHLRQLQAMYDAVGRMSKLNQSLLLLTKLGNNQFNQVEDLALAPLIDAKLGQLEDLIHAKGLQVDSSLDRIRTRINPYLADILLNNLLVNAIHHNRQGGRIQIRLQEDRLVISNSGDPLPFEPGALFNRFTRGQHSEGTGLGLAIVRQICDNYGFPLQYSYENGMHSMSVGLSAPGAPWLQNFPKIDD